MKTPARLFKLYEEFLKLQLKFLKIVDESNGNFSRNLEFSMSFQWKLFTSKFKIQTL